MAWIYNLWFLLLVNSIGCLCQFAEPLAQESLQFRREASEEPEAYHGGVLKRNANDPDFSTLEVRDELDSDEFSTIIQTRNVYPSLGLRRRMPRAGPVTSPNGRSSNGRRPPPQQRPSALAGAPVGDLYRRAPPQAQQSKSPGRLSQIASSLGRGGTKGEAVSNFAATSLYRRAPPRTQQSKPPGRLSQIPSSSNTGSRGESVSNMVTTSLYRRAPPRTQQPKPPVRLPSSGGGSRGEAISNFATTSLYRRAPTSKSSSPKSQEQQQTQRPKSGSQSTSELSRRGMDFESMLQRRWPAAQEQLPPQTLNRRESVALFEAPDLHHVSHIQRPVSQSRQPVNLQVQISPQRQQPAQKQQTPQRLKTRESIALESTQNLGMAGGGSLRSGGGGGPVGGGNSLFSNLGIGTPSSPQSSRTKGQQNTQRQQTTPQRQQKSNKLKPRESIALEAAGGLAEAGGGSDRSGTKGMPGALGVSNQFPSQIGFPVATQRQKPTRHQQTTQRQQTLNKLKPRESVMAMSTSTLDVNNPIKLPSGTSLNSNQAQPQRTQRTQTQTTQRQTQKQPAAKKLKARESVYLDPATTLKGGPRSRGGGGAAGKLRRRAAPVPATAGPQ